MSGLTVYLLNTPWASKSDLSTNRWNLNILMLQSNNCHLRHVSKRIELPETFVFDRVIPFSLIPFYTFEQSSFLPPTYSKFESKVCTDIIHTKIFIHHFNHKTNYSYKRNLKIIWLFTKFPKKNLTSGFRNYKMTISVSIGLPGTPHSPNLHFLTSVRSRERSYTQHVR